MWLVLTASRRRLRSANGGEDRERKAFVLPLKSSREMSNRPRDCEMPGSSTEEIKIKQPPVEHVASMVAAVVVLWSLHSSH